MNVFLCIFLSTAKTFGKKKLTIDQEKRDSLLGWYGFLATPYSFVHNNMIIESQKEYVIHETK